MKYKHFYIAISIRLTIIVLFSAGFGYFCFYKHLCLQSAFFLIIILITSINLVRYFNKLNRWISFYLLGIENEDTGLRIPSNSGDKAIDEVLQSIQSLNRFFKQTKIDIAANELYFKEIINQSATGLFSVNEYNRIVHINPAAMQLTGLHEQHHINSLHKIAESLPDFILHSHGKTTQVFENKSGQKLLFKRSEILIKKQRTLLIAVSDITKELDRQEVTSWIKLARTLSHEIMNNITPITTLSQVITGYLSEKNASQITQEKLDNAVKGLKVIEERSASLMHFVQNYRKFTKLPQPKISNVNLSKVLENCFISISLYPEFDRIKIEKDIPANIIFPTDENLISQVFINLLKNAYEAAVEDENPFIKIQLLTANNRVTIQISNNGKTIPEDLKDQIFVPFFSTKTDGSGIGLSLSKQILLQMKGKIILKTNQNNLTQFDIVLENIEII